MRSIITVLLVIVLVVAGVWWWRTYHSPNPYDGSVRRDAAMENGTTTMENGQNLGEEAHPTPSRSDAPGTINTEPVANSYDLGTETKPITQDPYGANYDGRNNPNSSRDLNSPNDPRNPYARKPNAPQVSYDAKHPPYYPTDSQSPDAPNGVRFGGNGVYQWYRQGDLTYRVDTRTGSSCIIYATLEEWRKPYVYHHGCR